MKITVRHLALIFCLAALVALGYKVTGALDSTQFPALVLTHFFVGIAGVLASRAVNRFDRKNHPKGGGMFG